MSNKTVTKLSFEFQKPKILVGMWFNLPSLTWNILLSEF